MSSPGELDYNISTAYSFVDAMYNIYENTYLHLYRMLYKTKRNIQHFVTELHNVIYIYMYMRRR